MSGFVRVQDVRDRTRGDDGELLDLNQGRVQAAFGDFSVVSSTAAAAVQLSDQCVGLVSLPQTGPGRVPLALEMLTVEGLSGGAREAMEASEGTYVDVGALALPMSGELRVVGTEAAQNGFPSFDETLDSVAAIDLLSPPRDGTGEIRQGILDIAWTSGDGDWIEIEIAPPRDQVSSGGQVLCRVADDGCYQLPASATAFLLSNNADPFTLSISRVRYRALEPELDAFLEINVVSELKVTLDNGVFE